MPIFTPNRNKQDAKRIASILRRFKVAREESPSSFADFIYLYFESEIKVDYFIDWCSSVYRNIEVDRAIIINDCSFSRAFTTELMDVLNIIIPDCEIVCLIREDEPLEERWRSLSFEMLDMLLHKNISALGYKTDIKNANCIIVIPHSSYLRRELTPDGVSIVLNVKNKYSNLVDEEYLMHQYRNACKRKNLLKDFEELLRDG